MKRRKLFRHSLSFFLGLNLVYLKSKSVRSENSPSPSKENNITTTVSGQIQPGLSLEYFQNVLFTNPLFKNNYSHFVEQSFDFQADSINFIDVQNNNNEPFFFTQLSGQRKKENENDSLVESVSLPSVYTNKGLLNLGISGTILANKFSNETQLINALVVYPSKDDLDNREKIERNFLEKESPKAIANKLRELQELQENSLSYLTDINSLSEAKKSQNLDFNTSIILNNLDNFLFLILSIESNVQSGLEDFNHSDKYILEKFAQVITILIDEYKSELEKLKLSSKVAMLSSTPDINYRLSDDQLFVAWIQVVNLILSVVSIIVTLGSIIQGCTKTDTKQDQEKTTSQKQKVEFYLDGTIKSVEVLGPPTSTTENVGPPYSVPTTIPGCTACGR
jgi:hypothetical protein